MLSLETRLNGTLIGFAYIHNESPVDNTSCLYYIEYHRINREPKIIEFKIKHNREEGAEKLALKVYREIDKRLKNIEKNKEK